MAQVMGLVRLTGKKNELGYDQPIFASSIYIYIYIYILIMTIYCVYVNDVSCITTSLVVAFLILLSNC